jgi:hypothetical protein
MSAGERPLAGIGLRLFRIWLYAPYPFLFFSLGVQFLLSRFPSTGGTIGFLLCFLTGFGFAYFIRMFERKVGHSNLSLGPTVIAICLTIVCMIAWPSAFYVQSLIRPMGSNTPVELHLHLSVITAGMMPIVLLMVNWRTLKK